MKISAGEFLEWAEVPTGTSAAPPGAAASTGSPRHPAGTSSSISTCRGPARSGRTYGRSTLIFVLPPSMETLRSRLFMRMRRFRVGHTEKTRQGEGGDQALPLL
ncbi:MAG: hypothetical protein MZV70_28260 [Desulfobacterales bacterium]|nr:hypothetical protein [Desulfobacterales bacterium]